MASSGRINGSVTNLSNHFSYYIEWEVASQSVAENASYLNVREYWATDNRAYTFDTVGNRSTSINIGGNSDSASKRFTCNPWPSDAKYLIWQRANVKVLHDSDGSKTITISARANGHALEYGPSSSISSSGDCTASGTITLPTIPRQANITSAPNFNDTQDPTIAYSNPAGESVSSLQAAISLDGSSADIAYRDVTKTGTSYQFILTAAERTVLRNATPGASRSVYFLLKTVIGTNTFTASAEVTFSVKESADSKPTVSLGASPDNSALPNTTPFSGLYIQQYSKADVVVTAVAQYGASIASISTSLDGAVYSGASFKSAALANSGTLAITATVTDSRGFVSTATINISVYAYYKPTISPITGESEVRCFRATNGTADPGSNTLRIHFVGGRAPIVSGSTQKNSYTAKWRIKLASAAWGSQSWNTITPDTGDTFNQDLSATLLTIYAYTVQLRVTDTVGEYSDIFFDIPTDFVTFQLGDGGRTAGFGGYPDTSIVDTLQLMNSWRLLGGIYLDTVSDLNDVLNHPGAFFYYCGAGVANCPENYTFVISMVQDSTCAAQLAYASISNTLYRRKYSSGQWTPWT